MPLNNVRAFLLIVIAVCHVQEDADLERRKKKAFIQNNNLENLRKNIPDGKQRRGVGDQTQPYLHYYF